VEARRPGRHVSDGRPVRRIGRTGSGEQSVPVAVHRSVAEILRRQGANAGGTPLLEDGMEIKTARFSAKDEQFVEASKLSLETCAQVYHINPTMIGMLDNANYSNVREFRKMLYGDNLGPEIERMQQRSTASWCRAWPTSRTATWSSTCRRSWRVVRGAVRLLLQRAIGGPYMTTRRGSGEG
jgi:hypothetical protein